jgi:uncharacterized protein YdeI (YjbR/CyaY-like superfamily)
MGVMDDAERLEPAALADWTAWLAAHHDETRGVWLVTPRQAADQAFDYEAAVCEALRYGWIDATVRVLDDTRAMQWFAPRRRGSGWSRSNKVRIERLEREGLMEAPGRAVIDAAKADGSWTVLDDVEDLVVPPDLAAAFAAHPGSREQWDGFSPSARKMMLAWVVTAKQEATRAKRVGLVAAKAAVGEKAHA